MVYTVRHLQHLLPRFPTPLISTSLNGLLTLVIYLCHLLTMPTRINLQAGLKLKTATSNDSGRTSSAFSTRRISVLDLSNELLTSIVAYVVEVPDQPCQQGTRREAVLNLFPRGSITYQSAAKECCAGYDNKVLSVA